MKERPRTSTVLFDLAGVLVRWDPRNLYRKVFADDPEEMEWFLATVCTPQWIAEQDRGRPFHTGIRLLTARFPQYREPIAQFFDRWEEMLDGEISPNVALVREIAGSGRPVYAISNWSAETFPIARRRFPFFRHFSGIVVSGEEGCVKPSPEIFAVAQRRYGLRPADTTFVDDTRINHHSARRLGYDSIHYRDPAHLREELAARGWRATQPRPESGERGRSAAEPRQ